jgi:transposase-like protein
MFPKTKEELDQLVSSEQACRQFLDSVRWQNGFHCLACGSTHGWRTARGQVRCSSCQRQWSLTSGSILDGTRKPLSEWVRAVWHVTGRKSGISALGLQQELGLASYQTAWAWLHKIRQAMVQREWLYGNLEVDGIVLGGTQDSAFRNKWKTPAIILIAVEVAQQKMGRLRIREVPEISGQSLTRFLQEGVQGGALIRTHTWKNYSELAPVEYQFSFTDTIAENPPNHPPLPAVNYVSSALRRWLRGTYCGGVNPRCLQSYLDEFAFRANHRSSQSRADLFRILLCLVMEPIAEASARGRREAARA